MLGTTINFRLCRLVQPFQIGQPPESVLNFVDGPFSKAQLSPEIMTATFKQVEPFVLSPTCSKCGRSLIRTLLIPFHSIQRERSANAYSHLRLSLLFPNKTITIRLVVVRCCGKVRS